MSGPPKDVPVPLTPLSLVPTRRKPGATFAHVTTDEERWRSELAALIRSTNPEFYALLDLAKSPLPTLKEAERILSVAERNRDPDLEAKIGEVVASMAKPKAAPRRGRRRKRRRTPAEKPAGPPSVFAFGIIGDLGAPGSLAASGKPQTVRVVTNAIWMKPDEPAVTAAAARSQRRRRTPSGRPGSGTTGPKRPAAGRSRGRRKR